MKYAFAAFGLALAPLLAWAAYAAEAGAEGAEKSTQSAAQVEACINLSAKAGRADGSADAEKLTESEQTQLEQCQKMASVKLEELKNTANEREVAATQADVSAQSALSAATAQNTSAGGEAQVITPMIDAPAALNLEPLTQTAQTTPAEAPAAPRLPSEGAMQAQNAAKELLAYPLPDPITTGSIPTEPLKTAQATDGSKEATEAAARTTLSRSAKEILENGEYPATKPERAQLTLQYCREEGYKEQVCASVMRTIDKESNFRHDVKNPTSSAFGVGQYINSTWKAECLKYLDATATECTQMRADPQAQMDVLMESVNERYEKYQNGTLKCNGLSFDACNYAVYHYAGSWSAPGNVQVGLNYYNSTVGRANSTYQTASATLGSDPNVALAQMTLQPTSVMNTALLNSNGYNTASLGGGTGGNTALNAYSVPQVWGAGNTLGSGYQQTASLPVISAEQYYGTGLVAFQPQVQNPYGGGQPNFAAPYAAQPQFANATQPQPNPSVTPALVQVQTANGLQWVQLPATAPTVTAAAAPQPKSITADYCGTATTSQAQSGLVRGVCLVRTEAQRV